MLFEPVGGTVRTARHSFDGRLVASVQDKQVTVIGLERLRCPFCRFDVTKRSRLFIDSRAMSAKILVGGRCQFDRDSDIQSCATHKI
jgi:hypothetical protein